MDDKNQFITLERKGRAVTFDNDGKEKIIKIDKIYITLSIFINNILLVDGLKYNLLSINHLYDKGFKVIFESSTCIISSPFEEGAKFIEHRHSNIYIVDLDEIIMK